MMTQSYYICTIHSPDRYSIRLTVDRCINCGESSVGHRAVGPEVDDDAAVIADDVIGYDATAETTNHRRGVDEQSVVDAHRVVDAQRTSLQLELLESDSK